MSKDYDYVNPPHYKQGEKELWEIMVDEFGVDDFITFCKLNAFKYRSRMGRKPTADSAHDEAKAKWYDDKARELQTKVPPQKETYEQEGNGY